MTVTANIPIIDLSAKVLEGDIARRLVDAAIEHGFIYIKNTGADISVEKVASAFDMLRLLFSSGPEEKERCKMQKNNRGWSGMHQETLDPKHHKIGDFKEIFNFGEFKDGKATQPVPSSLSPEHEAAISSFWDSCHTLCIKIVTLLGIGLQVDPPDFFAQAHDPSKGPSGTTLRFLHYPAIPPGTDTSDGIRAGAHSDYGSVTLLFRLPGQPGLQVLDKTDRWLPVPVLPAGTENDAAPPILVNIGDLLSYWTNGLLRSTVHRVVLPAETPETEAEADLGTRHSIAFFCHPAGAMRLEPVPSEVVRNHVPGEAGIGVAGGGQRAEVNPYLERKVLTADEHLWMRLQASYLSLYKEENEAAS